MSLLLSQIWNIGPSLYNGFIPLFAILQAAYSDEDRIPLSFTAPDIRVALDKELWGAQETALTAFFLNTYDGTSRA